MRKLMFLTLALTFCALVALPSSSFAYGGIADDWMAYYPNACDDLVAAADGCFLCHGESFSMNPYGADVDEYDQDFGAIEGIDSDEDGRTNGEEINDDCTLPGDAGSVPNDTSSWSNLKMLFR